MELPKDYFSKSRQKVLDSWERKNTKGVNEARKVCEKIHYPWDELSEEDLSKFMIFFNHVMEAAYRKEGVMKGSVADIKMKCWSMWKGD